jgi:DNA-binding NtrC family response regulator
LETDLRPIDAIDRELVRVAINACGGCKKRAAEALGYTVATLNLKVEKYRLQWPEPEKLKRPGPRREGKLDSHDPTTSLLRWHQWKAIEECLFRHAGNRSATARELGISIRSVRNWCAWARSGGLDVPEPLHYYPRKD